MVRTLRSADVVRTHVVLPAEIVAAVDRLAGRRHRSRFLAQAAREKLLREDQGRALRETAGTLSAADYPEWSTPEKISAWVRESRRLDDEATEQKLRDTQDE